MTTLVCGHASWCQVYAPHEAGRRPPVSPSRGSRTPSRVRTGRPAAAGNAWRPQWEELRSGKSEVKRDRIVSRGRYLSHMKSVPVHLLRFGNEMPLFSMTDWYLLVSDWEWQPPKASAAPHQSRKRRRASSVLTPQRWMTSGDRTAQSRRLRKERSCTLSPTPPTAAGVKHTLVATNAPPQRSVV